MFNFYKNISIGVLVSILSGCLATTNLLTDGKLGAAHLQVANEMADRTSKNCVTVQYRGGSEEPMNNMKMRERPDVKSLWESDSDWYKAEMLVQQAWDNIYYNNITGRLVCGQKNWDKFSESRTIRFIRVDEKQPSLNIRSNPSQPTSTDIETAETRLTKLKSLHNKKLISDQQYDEQVKRILADQ